MARRASAGGGLLPGEAELQLASQLHPQETSKLWQLFNEFDADGDGRINAKDIARAMAREGLVVPRRQLEQCLWEADTDSDGYLEFLDLLSLYARGKAFGVSREAQLLQHFILYLVMSSEDRKAESLTFDNALAYLCHIMGREAALRNLEKLFGADSERRTTASLKAGAWLRVLGSALWSEASPLTDEKKEQERKERRLRQAFRNSRKTNKPQFTTTLPTTRHEEDSRKPKVSFCPVPQGASLRGASRPRSSACRSLGKPRKAL